MMLSIGLLVRRMAASEKAMVLSNWKKELLEESARRGWGRGLEVRDYWCLANHVLDRITLPSCEIWVGCHESELETPVCWVAIRKIAGLSVFEVVYLYARQSVRELPELAAGLELALLHEVEITRPLARERRSFNPFLELRR